jgi:hypothetical protein
MKKHYYLIIDTESTMRDSVADFGAVVVTRQGEIVEQFGAMVEGHFGVHPLFFVKEAKASDFWSAQSAKRRAKGYRAMLSRGERVIASPAAIVRWLERVRGQYNPAVTAYNIRFDVRTCRNTGIDLGMFGSRFCLMRAAQAHIGKTEAYAEFCHAHGLLTPTGRLKTTADAMAKFVLGADLEDEPHTALEDARDYEAVILAYILRDLSRKKLLAIG